MAYSATASIFTCALQCRAALCQFSNTPVPKFQSIRARAAAIVMLDHSCQVQRAPMHEHRGDYYDTPEVAVHALLKHVTLPRIIWEPACGTGTIVRVLR